MRVLLFLFVLALRACGQQQQPPGIFNVQAWVETFRRADFTWSSESLRRTIRRGGPLSLLTNLNPLARLQMSLFPPAPALIPEELKDVDDSTLALRIMRKASFQPAPLTSALKHRRGTTVPFAFKAFAFQRLSDAPTPDEVSAIDNHRGFVGEGGFIDA